MNDIEKRAQDALAGLGPVHGKLLTEGYEGSADAVTDAGEVIRELLAHYNLHTESPHASAGGCAAVRNSSSQKIHD